MKVVRYTANGATSFGSLEGESVYPIVGDPLSDFSVGEDPLPLSGVRLTAPCVPPKVIGVAINYPGITGSSDDFVEPLVFLMSSNTVIGPDDPIVSPFREMNTWGESELAIVIGRTLTRASKTDVENGGIFGFTIGNDVSCSNVQGWDHHLARAKSIDTFCPLGPFIDTEYDPADKLVESYHNGELLRRGNSDDRLMTDLELVSFLSSWMTLEPWDVILTGAPARVRDRLYLGEGDVFECKVAGLGELRNSFTFERNSQ